MNIDTGSVVKAGGIAAAVGLVLGVLGSIPVLNCLFAPLFCVGAILLPIGAGVGYGYYAPGREDLGQSAIGGALAGAFGGFAYGLMTGLMALFTNAGAAAFLEDADIAIGVGGSAASFLGSLCVPIFTGLILGAIGGLIWPIIQSNRT